MAFWCWYLKQNKCSSSVFIQEVPCWIESFRTSLQSYVAGFQHHAEAACSVSQSLPVCYQMLTINNPDRKPESRLDVSPTQPGSILSGSGCTRKALHNGRAGQ